MNTQILSRFTDEEGRIRQWPANREKQLVVLEHLAKRFEMGQTYREREVNQIIESAHTFGDFFLLRRELVEAGLLARTRDGSCYWKPGGEQEKSTSLH